MISSSLLITAFLCLAIGYFAGILVISLTGNQQSPGNEEKAESQQGDSGGPVLPNPAGEKIFLLCEDADHSLHVELEGTRFANASVLDADQYQALQNLQKEFLDWLDLADSSSRIDKKKGEKIGQNKNENNVPEIKKNKPKGEVNSRKSLILTEKSIVEQVDEILQQQIGGTPLEMKGIKLGEIPGQGVCVWIGLERFLGIESVTDPEVKDAIRNAVRAWEEKAK